METPILYDDYDYDDEYHERDDEEEFCYHCQDRGYIPAMDFESIQGIEGWACDHCDRGINSNFPFRPTSRTGADHG
jgi:hypothetical protein